MAGSGSRSGNGRPAGGSVTSDQPLTQKEKWAQRAEQRRQQADRAEAKARALEGGGSRDRAYLSQPGRIAGRARDNARSERAFQERQKAAELRQRAANLDRMATTQKGTAAAQQQARRDAFDKRGYKVGDTVQSALYGPRRIVRINKKTVTLAGGGRNFTEDKARLR